MHVVADVCIIPIGVGVSVSREVTECERTLRATGLKTQLHAYGTNIEGEWDHVFAAVRQCHEALHAMGVQRVSTSIRVGSRTDKAQGIQDKIDRVERALGPKTSDSPSV